MMDKQKWISYNQLAWIEPILSPPEQNACEAERYINTILDKTLIEVKNMLHLGSGAGILDYTFKKHFKITGIDLSDGMIDVARTINPEVNYIKGDMRYFKLDGQFDTVIIPDSLFYMVSEEDLCLALHNASRHLKPGGVLLLVCHYREVFQNNNFVYTGSAEGIDITVFENNYILDKDKTLYEATIVYLIRKGSDLEIFTDRHVLGLHSAKLLATILSDLHFDLNEESLDDLYEPFLMDSGRYELAIVTGVKTGRKQ